MISLRQRLQCLPSLGGGIIAGSVLALLVWRGKGVEPALVVLVAGLPFLLATMTGIAKTTTVWGISMIGTIGSLVQETSNRWRWLLSTGLYTITCLTTSMLLGAVLGAIGHLIDNVFRSASVYTVFPYIGAGIIGLLAIAYAVSDVGLLRLPRPVLSKAVPITWWRQWGPYGAALSYGAALGIGVMTQIPFGAFYVLCIWCILKGDAAYGALLMGTYGLMRALVLLPVSWGLNCCHIPITDWATSPFFNQWRAQQVLAVALIMFGTFALVSTLLGMS